jgi:hypothetical protein
MWVRVSWFPYIVAASFEDKQIVLVTRLLFVLPLKVSSSVRLCHTSIIISIVINSRHRPIVP